MLLMVLVQHAASCKDTRVTAPSYVRSLDLPLHVRSYPSGGARSEQTLIRSSPASVQIALANMICCS